MANNNPPQLGGGNSSAPQQPQPAPGQEPTGSTGSAVDQLTQGLGDAMSYITGNPEVALAGLAVAGVAYFLYKKHDERALETFEGIDWEVKIPSDLKYLVNSVGFDTEKELTRGDYNQIGEVHSYDTQKMPANREYQDLVFGGKNQEGDDDIEFDDVYVFMVAPKGLVSGTLWKITDLHFNQDFQTKLYVVNKDSVEVENDRFKMDENIQFKLEYGNIMMQKSVATENVTDQFPIYKARKNIVEGLEEFTMKTLFLDRNHSTAIAQMREDIDEDTIQEFLNRGKNF